MNSIKAVLGRQFPLLAVLSASIAVVPCAFGQSVQHLSITQPGGIPGRPTLTGVEPGSNYLTVTWDGPAGYYQLFQKTSEEAPWQALGGRTNVSRRAFVNVGLSNSMFRVFGPAPEYIGAQSCAECHGPLHEQFIHTPHPGALESLTAIGQAQNASCLPCHTVGFGVPTGFISQAKTPQLAGVQCENCHGPAGYHAANPEDSVVRPRVEIAATVCGGCHTGPMQPTFEEWKSSPHSDVVEDMNPPDRISSCGRCHSGSSRLALLQNRPLPQGDANMPITCVVCHDPHQEVGNTALLRNPVFSTNDFFLTTAEPFLSKYDPSINICAQCHNHRGAAWTTTSRPPHHSPQYNILIGTVGELQSGQRPNDPAAHAFLEKQCVSCHMQSHEAAGSQPAVTGHSFRVESYDLCLNCHPFPELLVEFTTGAVSNQIAQVKAALDVWATTKAPEALRAKYGKLAWEYTVPGTLSVGSAGPSSAEQAQIPEAIKKARFDMYLVYHDGSFGVHNGPYSITLLNTAMNWVQQELSK